MLCDRYRAKRICRSAACDDDIEKRLGRGDLVSLLVGDDVAGMDLAELFSDGRRNADDTRVESVDHYRLQVHRLGELLTKCRLVVARLFRKHVGVEILLG